MAKPRDDRQKDLLRPALEAIIDLGHPLVRLAHEIDWGFLDGRFAGVCAPGAGQPGLPTRLVAGLFILKHMHDLSDEALCARWLENPYYQFFCGEESFRHRLRFDRSSLTRWRQRLGGEELVALLQESLSVAHKTGALVTRDLERVVVDTTVQPKAIAHPTDARLCYRAIEKLVDLARRNDVPLRQSYRRVAKRAAIMVGRYTHAHQFNRARRELKFLRIRLGRVIRDIRRKIAGSEALKERFAGLLALAMRVQFQDHRQRGQKVYALHAPEVECIGKGKARAPYEFGCKVSIATPATKPKGGQFVLHAKALHGNPFDGHTLAPVIMTSNLGAEALLALGEDEPVSRARDEVMDAVRRAFRPEFLNRLDDVLVFGRLGRDDMAQIVDIQLGRVNERLAERGLSLVADEAACRRLAELGWDPAFGARPLKRAIQGLVEDPISEHLLDQSEDASEQRTLSLTVVAGRLALDGEIVEDDRPQGFKAPERAPIGFALAGSGLSAGGSGAVH